jgi:hypothetical protein
MSQRYELNEKDIDKALNYLRIHHSDLATPENAVKVSQAMYVIAHEAAAHGKKIDLDEAIEQAIQQVRDLKG